MANLIVDASIAAACCFPDEETSYTNDVLRAVSKPLEAEAPHLLAYEVRNTTLTGIKRASRGSNVAASQRSTPKTSLAFPEACQSVS